MSEPKKVFTCIGKGGSYELIGYASPGGIAVKDDEYVDLGIAKGAGLSKPDKLHIYKTPNGELIYIDNCNNFYTPIDPKPVYKDLNTSQLYFREKFDFDKRMAVVE